MKTKSLGMAALLLVAAGQVKAQSFNASDIRVEGLERVSAATVFNAFPLSPSDRIDEQALADATRELFNTGLFEDVSLARENDVLIIEVEERPTIGRLTLAGNDVISDEDLRKGLSDAGLAEGDVLKLSTLDDIERELSAVYQARGRYSARINSSVEEIGDGRVDVTIDIREGQIARIRQINIVGNQAFSNDTLLDEFELDDSPGVLFGWFANDQYSREALAGDIERLRSFYLDRGYVDFNLESSQVSIGPEKNEIFINLNISEGPRYRVGRIRLEGDLRMTEREARSLLEIEQGEVFSRRELNASTEALRNRLGEQGFAFAEVQGLPQRSAEEGAVDILMSVDPGQRTYVRRIEFKGNTTTADEVLRREMVQMEGAPASTAAITQSRERLQRLGFFSQVEVETRRVAGEADQLDIAYRVEEQPSGSVSASVGFSQSAGVIYGLGLSQNNFLGTGNRVNVSAQRSETQTNINLGFTDPYWTMDGISRGYNLFYREANYEDADISTYSTDAFGGGLSIGYPISEVSRLNFGLDAQELTIKTYNDSAQEITGYVDAAGDNAQSLRLTTRWTRNNLNRGMMPTAGNYQRLSLEAAVPGSDASFYKARARLQQLMPLDDEQRWVLKLSTNLGYAQALESDERYPFYENFFAGGLGSVRGYTSNTLGVPTTQASGARDRTLGGNVLLQGSAEILFPLPFIDDQRAFQAALFVDGGNTFLTDCYPVANGNSNCTSGIDMDKLRYSSGIGLSWLTAVGSLTFSFAEPLNDEEGDDLQFFQFSLGQSF